MPTAVTDLYSEEPTAAKGKGYLATAKDATAAQAADPTSFKSQDATASYAGTKDAAAMSGAASGYGAATGVVDPSTMTSAGQLTGITASGSPLMQRAAQEGLLQAGRRGLDNSSIAAGAATGAMVDRATPLAQQDASTYFNQSLANQAATNRASEFTAAEANKMTGLNTQLANDVSMANAKAMNEANALNAQLETAVSQGNQQEANRIQTRLTELQTEIDLNNASMQTNTNMANADAANRASLANADNFTNVSIQNAAQQNQLKSQVLQQNAALNEQFMRGEQAMDLASIQGRYQQLISSNESASRLYDSYFQSISAAMSNDKIGPDRVAQYVNVQQSMLEAGLRMMDSLNTLDLGDFELPGATGTPGGPPQKDTGTITGGSITPTTGTAAATAAPAPGATEATLQAYLDRFKAAF